MSVALGLALAAFMLQISLRALQAQEVCTWAITIQWIGLIKTGSEGQMYSNLELKHSDLAGNGLCNLQGCGRSVYRPLHTSFRRSFVSPVVQFLNMCTN